jgi:hypothetical protein
MHNKQRVADHALYSLISGLHFSLKVNCLPDCHAAGIRQSQGFSLLLHLL